ncbi:MAG: GEVED domain-containing protein, partial [Bacteroidota bacterium]
MKNINSFLRAGYALSITLFLILNFFVRDVKAQCFSAPSYCTSISASNVSGFGMGIQNVSLGYSGTNFLVNNTTASGNGSPIYFNYTNLIDTAYAGSTVYYSIKVGNSNQTTFRIYIDWNNDGTFNTSAPELVYTSATTAANGIVTGTFVVPIATTAGTYRIRIASDYTTAPGPCGPLVYSAEFEDYTLLVPSPTIDAMSGLFTSPSFFVAGNNTIGFSFTNISNATLTSISVGYQLDANTPVTQNLTGLTVAPGATYTATFATPLNIASTGTFNLKAWQTNPNGAGSVSAANDTICRTVVTYCAGALNGTYTIDPAGSGPTNFTRFGAADSALMSCGVSGPVRFNVAAGTYTEQVYLSNVTGTSATNTITFDGGNGNAATRIVTFTASAGAPYTLRLDGANWITFRNIDFRGTSSTDAWVVHFLNGTNNRVNNCIIEITGAGATSTATNLYALVVNGSASSVGAVTTLSNNITVDSCTLNAGYYSVYNSMSTGSNVFTLFANTINNAYYYGYYSINTHSPRIRANTFNLRTSMSNNYGIYIQSCNNSGSDYFEISRNTIINPGQYGIYLNSCSNSGSAANQIYNNMIGGGFRYTAGVYGIYLTSASKTNIYHNSINIDVNTTSGSTAGIYISNGSANDVRNNHIFISNAASLNSVPVWLSASSVVNFLDYNNYFNSSSTALLNIGGSNITTLNYKVALPNGGGVNSINYNPSFVSSTNLHTTNGCNKGINLSVAVDVDGQTRSTTPNIGADELITFTNNDIGVLKINSPNFPLAAGSQTINVTLRNYGGNLVTGATINYSVNGGAVTSQLWSGSMNTCDTVNFAFTVPYTVTLALTNLKVYTTLPNGTADASPSNDTAQFSLTPAMSGIYTIDPAGSGATNYTTFNLAASALATGGISGPVTFNVAAGTYNEQVTIPGTILGSPTNSITFQSASGTASSVVLTFSGTSNNFTLRLSGSNNIKFRNMTVTATNVTYGTALAIINNASNDSFYNVVFNSVVTTSAANQSLAVIYCNGGVSNNIYFDTCRVNNGSYGSYFYSNSTSTLGTTSQNVGFNNCDFVNQYSYGMYNMYLDGYKITRNRITTNSAYTAYYGMYNYWIMVLANVSKPVCSGNRIWGAVGGYGIYNYYVGVNSMPFTAINKPIYANNMIQIGSVANATYGIYDAYSYSADYINNSVNIGCTQTTNTSAAAWFVASNDAQTKIQNNIFAAYGGAPAIRIDGGAGYPTINYNDYYTTGANLGYISATAYTTFALWKTAIAKDVNSVNVIPNYVSTTDLHISTSTNVLSIAANALALMDYDNMARCATTDIGADHHPANDNIGVSSLMFPYGGVAAAGARDVKVYIRNFGNNVVTSANVRYKDNTTTYSVAWTGYLNPCDSVLVTFTGANQYTFSGAWSLKFFTDGPNGNLDADRTNDTISTSGCTGMAGTYTIDPLGSGTSNYTTFALALTALQSCGVGGPVTFNVAAATFAEQVSVPNINGTNAINTITFDGGNGNAATRIIAFASVLANPHVVRFNACNYITFRNMTIRSTGATDAWVVNFMNGTNNRVNNCVIEITGTGATATTANLIPVVVNGSTTTLATVSTLANNITVDSCTLNAGYYSVYSYMSTSANVFTMFANTLNNAYYSGYYSVNTFSPRIIANTFNIRTSNTTNYGIYMQSCNNSGTDYYEISRNKILNAGYYGVFLNSNGNSGSSTNSVINNMVGGGFRYSAGEYGIYLSSCTKTNVYHNSVILDFATTSGTNAAIYVANGSLNDVRNNHMVVNSATAFNAMPLYVTPSTAISFCDNNNYYNRSGAVLVNIGGTNYTASSYRNSFPSGGGLSSINTDPAYTSTTNLHVSAPCNNGANLGVTIDVDGDARGTTPDIGADEVITVPNNEIGIYTINNPAFPLSVGSKNIRVTIKNYGNNVLTSATLNYQVNGGTVVSQAWSGSLNPCDTIGFTFTTPYTVTSGVTNIKSFTTLPNGFTDANSLNDTFQYSLCPALVGTYTVGSGGNYATLSAAISDLSCGGMAGPVTLSMLSGTYGEQVNILGTISGLSAANALTIQSQTGNAADVNISYSGSSSANYTINLNGASFVKFRNLTISANNTTYGTALSVMNNASSDSFFNVTFNSVVTTTNSSSLAVIYSPSSSVSNYICFDACKIYNGAYGSYFYSTGSTTIGASSQMLTFNNCDFVNQYAYGLSNNNLEGLKLTGNRISTNSTLTSYYGMYNYWITINLDANRPLITGNKIWGAVGGYGMYNNYLGVNSGYTVARRPLIANNMIQIGSGANATYGIYDMYSAGQADYIHNSVNIGCTQTANTSAAAWFATPASYPGTTILNNIFAAYAGAPAIRMDATAMYASSDYNDLYTTGTNIGYLSATAYTTLVAYRAALTKEANSINVVPNFATTTNLHVNQTALNNVGSITSLVTTDFDGQSRCPNSGCVGGTTNPDIGADEFIPAAFDASVTSVDGPLAICSGASSNVFATFMNFGTTTLTSANVSWSVNGVAQTPFSWTGSLAQGASSGSINIGAYTFVTGTELIKVWPTNLNGSPDQNNINDTVQYTPAGAGLSGTYTIGGVSPNYASFTAAINAMNTMGICGPVTFNVAAGYTETIATTLSLTATGTISSPIIFQKSGSGANPKITSYTGGAGTPGTAVQDGIFRLVGSDYVTIDGIDLAENVANTTNNATMEYGYALYKGSVTNGCQYNTIKNCVITLNRINNATSTAPAVEGSVGINVMNATAIAATTNLIPTAQSGTNSYNKFYGNTIQNCNIGIAIIGYAAATPFILADTANDIGGSSALTGNTIKNYGGGAVTNAAAAVRTLAQYGLNVSYNTINSNDGAGVNHATTLRGIYLNTAVSASANITNNNITVTCGGTTSQLDAIENVSGATAASNTINITSNTITLAYPTATTGVLYGIYNTATPTALNINSNTLNISTAATSGSLYPIYNSGAVVSTVNINNNNINSVNLTAATSSLAFRGIYVSTLAATAIFTANSNNLTGVNATGTLSGEMDFIYQGGSATTGSETVTNNTLTNVTFNTTGTTYLFYLSNSTNNVTVSNNSIVTGFTKNLAGAGTFYGIYNFGSPSSLTHYVTQNNFSNITLNSTSTALYGIYWQTGGSVNQNFVGNKVSNITNNGTGNIIGMGLTYGLTDSVYQDTVVNLSSLGNVTGMVLGNSSTTNMYAYNNFINTLSSSGASAIVIGMNIGNSSGGANYYVNRNNINNLSCSGITSPLVYGMSVTAGTNINIYRNKIYNLSQSAAISTTAGAVIGLSLGAGTTVNAYNNLIGDLRAASASLADAIRGISITSVTASSSYNLYYNTVYLNATSTGTNFGTSGIYHAAIGTATTAALTMKNNIIYNNSTPAGTGYTVAHYRSSTALNNYVTSSNSNSFYAGTPGIANFVYYDGTNNDQTISAYKIRVTPADANSFAENMNFISTVSSNANFLKVNTTIPTQIESGAIVITTPAITDDHAGTTRNVSTPDIGAYEDNYALLDVVGPAISYTPLGNAIVGANQTLTATITDGTGLPLSGSGLPTLYYKVNTGSYTAVTGTSIGSNKYTFTFGSATTALADVVSYYIVAQDTMPTPNVSVYPTAGASGFSINPPAVSTPPTTPSTFITLAGISGVVTVGTGGTYTSITNTGGLFDDINNKVVTGPITAQIISDLGAEAGTISLLQFNASYSLKIVPDGVVARTISGSPATLISLSGADSVMIDGRYNNAGNYLNFTNTNSTTTSNVFNLAPPTATTNGCRNIIIRNTTITNGSTDLGSTATVYDILMQNEGHGNVLITQNVFKKSAIGILVGAGTVTVPYTGIAITNNIFGDATNANTISNFGIRLLNAKNALISGDTFINITTAQSFDNSSVELAAGSDSATVTNNTMYGNRNPNTGGYGTSGIYTSGANYAFIANNVIYNLDALSWSLGSTDALYGIRLQGGNGHRIYNNSINLNGTSIATGAYTSAAIGIMTGTGIDVRNNVLVNTLVGPVGYKSYAIIKLAAATLTTINNNDYFVSGATGVLSSFNSTDKTTLALWQASSLQDAASVSFNPGFASSTNLIPAACVINNVGQTISGITTDYAGLTRSVTPDIGAYEFTPTAITAPTVSSSTINYCQNATASVLSATGVNTLMWYTSSTGGIGSSTAPTPLTTTAGTTSYYVADSNATYGCVSSRTQISVIVGTPVSSNTTGGAQSLCSGSSASITGSTPAGGTGTFIYKWLLSSTSASAGFANAGGNDSAQNYSTSTLSLNSWYKRVVSSGSCPSDTTTAVAISITNAIATNTITGTTQTICSGSSPAQIAASTATGGDGSTYTYSWLSSTTSATAGFSAIATTNVQNYTPGVLTQNTWFR